MARSSGTRNHIVKSKQDTGELSQNGDGTTGPERVDFTSWCGETGRGFKTSYGSYSTPYGFEDYASVRSCTKCRSKYMAAELKANPIKFRLGERVDASDEAKNEYGVGRWHFKSCYPVIDTTIIAEEERDKVVGFITIDNGWGKTWEIHPWERTTRSSMAEPSEPKVSAGGCMDYTTADYTRSNGEISKGYKTEAKRLSSKEDALMLFPLLDEQGLLKTRQGLLAADREWLAKERQYETDREREREERAAQRERERIAAASEREQLIADIVVALDQEFLGNFVTDVLFRTAKAAGITEAEITAAMPKPEPVAPRSNVDLLRVTAEEIADHGNAPLYDPGPLAEVETDEWGEIIASR